MTITPENPASQEMNTARAIDTLLTDISAQLSALSNRVANLEANEGPVAIPPIIKKLYDNTISGNGSWNVQNSDLITGVGNFADYETLQIYLYGIRSTVALTFDTIYLLFGTGGGALDTTATNYSSAIDANAAYSRADTPRIAVVAAANSDANMYTDLAIEIYNLGSARNKNSRCFEGNRIAAVTHALNLIVHQWENTGTITRIGIQTDNDPTDLIESGGRLVIFGWNF